MTKEQARRESEPVTQKDTYFQLATAIRDALNVFIASYPAASGATVENAATGVEEADDRGEGWPTDPMTLLEIKSELGLKDHQVVKLRRLYQFPEPRRSNGKYLFSRGEVERWARVQPNPANFAAVLRLRRKRFKRG